MLLLARHIINSLRNGPHLDEDCRQDDQYQGLGEPTTVLYAHPSQRILQPRNLEQQDDDQSAEDHQRLNNFEDPAAEFPEQIFELSWPARMIASRPIR